jgi:CBS domain containing-hemolysin-like protein
MYSQEDFFKIFDYLKEQKVDVLIIPPQWRAKDILAEMEREGIKVASVVI